MRQLADADRIRQMMQGLGAEADQPTRIYFRGIGREVDRYPRNGGTSFKTPLAQTLPESLPQPSTALASVRPFSDPTNSLRRRFRLRAPVRGVA
jgi:hypothetical protein